MLATIGPTVENGDLYNVTNSRKMKLTIETSMETTVKIAARINSERCQH